MASDTGLERGAAALAAGDWQTARSEFAAAVAGPATPEALHGLGQALYWLGEYPGALATLGEAYLSYLASGQPRPAGRVATQLALLHGLIEGNQAAVSGWVRHAERALGDDPDCVEAGWLALLRACFAASPGERVRHASVAIDLGRRFADPSIEFDGVAYLGKAYVEQGQASQGLPLVDEALAAVSSGLVVDPWATAEILCTLFHACELAVDVRRAEDWLGAVDDHVERTGERPTYGICRMHYGGLLVAAGRWEDAERELLDAVAVYDAGYRGSRAEPVLRLADLRARQGRIEEAARLLEGYEDLAEAAVTRARIHLGQDDPELACTVLERYLDRRGRGTLSGPQLALLVEAQLACGRTDVAAALAAELGALAADDQPLLRGLALLSRGRVAAAGDEGDAVAAYEGALTVFADADLPCELAQTHLELARCLAPSRTEAARTEARAALRGFDRIGASAGADAAAALLRELGDRGRSWPRLAGRLTQREGQVLELLAEGCSNADIAGRLHLSVRTVEHHVSNILAKLGASNRAEAAAHAVRTGRAPLA